MCSDPTMPDLPEVGVGLGGGAAGIIVERGKQRCWRGSGTVSAFGRQGRRDRMGGWAVKCRMAPCHSWSSLDAPVSVPHLEGCSSRWEDGKGDRRASILSGGCF